MAKLFIRWFRRNFSNPQAIILAILLLAGFLLVYVAGKILMPILVALVLSYLLDWAVCALNRKGIPRLPAVIFVFILFIALGLGIIVGVIPLLGEQMQKFFADFPDMATRFRQLILALPDKYPEYVTREQVQSIINQLGGSLSNLGDVLVNISITSFKNIVSVMIYMVLVPLLVFFFLKDKTLILNWFARWLPENNELALRVWNEVDDQIGNYARGKVVEIFVVGVVTYVAFVSFGLNYALLLSVLVGLSVLVPYVGATIVTIPVALVGLLQWGANDTFLWLMITYLVIQALDGNLLVPLLFSEANNLHPVAIIAAVLFFGGIWGFWGVFFAIPLATLVVAVLEAWDFSRRNFETKETPE